MEACYAKGGQGSRNSIPQISVRKLAYQNCSRNNATVACAGSKGCRTTPDSIGKNIERAVRRRLRHIKTGFCYSPEPSFGGHEVMLQGSIRVRAAPSQGSHAICIATPVEAQQPPTNPSPSATPLTAPASTPATGSARVPAAPPWAQARPDEAVSANLAPVVPLPIATAPDKLPLSKLKLPKNFHIEVMSAKPSVSGP
jgi:hypothetical protein